MSTPHHAMAPTVPVADPIPLRRVLVSVYDKAGLDQLATALKSARIEVVSTGGTARALEAHGVKVTDVAAVTGFPEILDGRVKTLHPNIFAGLLYRRDRPDDIDIVARHGIGPIDAVIVNLYPFEAIVAQPDCRPADAIELIDIGGPSLVRAAAKNHAFAAVVTGPDQYPELIAMIARGGSTIAERRLLAARAFERTSAYDTAIAAWMARHAGLVAEPAPRALPPATGTLDAAPLPARFSLELQECLALRYGENPHQSAALYAPAGARVGLAGLKQLCGKELSYNNLLDLDGATRLAGLLEPPAAIVVKHTNPCGAATGSTIDAALATAMAADPTSAFGSIVAVNRRFDRACAELLLQPGLFVEVIAAPAFDPAAVELLTTKPTWKASVRLVEVPAGDPWEPTHGLELRSVAGAILAQRPDDCCDDPATWKVVTKKAPSPELTPVLDFAFTVVRRLTSNAIAVCQGPSLVGAGIGQTSRVDATRIALEKAGVRARGGVLASDAFFPFADSIPLIARAGIAAIVQPGGSKRDAEVIAAADEAGIPMVFTARRHFRH
ncbi:MAG: bifunctional phosphoribosylaminoimidazolecarboxamide formyltransferase/IMP cyclohydrolase [Planctomycetia bacterium]